jgi:uncharacterized membrane protein YkoI
MRYAWDLMRTATIFLILSMFAPMMRAAPGGAVVPPAPDQHAMVRATTMSMDQAVQMVEHRFRARVVKAETQTEAGRTLYVLRLLDESGKVWTVRVDADSGSLL